VTQEQADAFRGRVLRRLHQPADDHEIIGSMISNMILIARSLPRASRWTVAELLRDTSDQLERL